MNVHEERQKKLLEWATLSQVPYERPSQYSLGVPVQQFELDRVRNRTTLTTNH
jgi:hypothetical protein